MLETSWTLWAARALVIVLALAGWFWSQGLIARREAPSGRIDDRLHDWTATLNRALHAHPRRADALLVTTSATIDLLGLFLLAWSVFGPSFRPFVGLLLLFALRQACQGVCALPTPPGAIWRHPGVPSLLVTYGTSNDLFFSGHTAIAVYGAIELARLGGPFWIALGFAIAAIEAATVLVLRAHYTMDVYAGIVTALWIAGVAELLGPLIDAAFAGLPGI
jgi:hypothetical protein